MNNKRIIYHLMPTLFIKNLNIFIENELYYLISEKSKIYIFDVIRNERYYIGYISFFKFSENISKRNIH